VAALGTASRVHADDVERAIAAGEAALAEVEARRAAPEEGAAARAARIAAAGAAALGEGDAARAAFVLSAVVDDPALRAAGLRPRAVADLADALRASGDCATAWARYAEALADATSRPRAAPGALQCAVALRRLDDAERLSAEAAGPGAPAAVAYAAARALWLRRDAVPRARLDAALAAVPAPLDLAALHLAGARAVEDGDLAGAEARFLACTARTPADARAAAVREECALALARVRVEAGRPAAAIEAYEQVPVGSPRFDDARLELAWAWVKAGRAEDALRAVTIVTELSPGSLRAPDAAILQGHLELRLGRYSDATETYDLVINTWAPVRDEVDAILSLELDPVRTFALLDVRGGASRAEGVFPVVAVRWAESRPEMARALALVSALDRARRDARVAEDAAARVDAALAGDGLDAFPALAEVFAAADAVANAAAWAEQAAAARALADGASGLDPAGRAEAAALAARRAALLPRVAALPRSPQEARDRRARLQGRLEAVDREASRLALATEGLAAAAEGTALRLDRDRGGIVGWADERSSVTGELRRHGEIVKGYGDALRALRLELALARDAAAGAAALADEARVRAAWRDLAARERDLAARSAPGREAVARVAGGVARLDALRARAEAVQADVRGETSVRAGALRAAVAAERATLATDVRSLGDVRAAAAPVVGRIALDAFAAVRARFYDLVLGADVGLVDVAWARKRDRVARIQQLSAQEGAELRELDEAFRPLLQEVR
jgi:hypothetical protein